MALFPSNLIVFLAQRTEVAVADGYVLITVHYFSAMLLKWVTRFHFKLNLLGSVSQL